MRAHIRDAIRSGPVPKLRDWRGLPTSKLTRAERNMRFIERYCIVPEGMLVGKPVELADFQQVFFYAVYDNPAITTDAYLSIARKNSKTATIAMLVLVHLVGPEARENSEIVSGARAREQAALVFRYASKMVYMSPDLNGIIRAVPSKKMLVGLPMNVEYHAAAAEASTAFGGSPVVAILDEVGQVEGERDDFVDAIITSQGAHDDPLLVAISTQAPTDADMFSQWIDDASKGETPSIVCHVYEADKGADVTSKKQWRKANPALGLFRSEKDVARHAEKARRMPSYENTFRNLYLNQRVNTVSAFVSEDAWKGCGAAVPEMSGVDIWGGLDLSAKTDLTSLVLVWQQDGVWNVQPHFWTPEDGLRERAKRDRVPYLTWVDQGFLHVTPGKTVDYRHIVMQLPEILGDNNLKLITFDRWRINDFQREMDNEGLELPMEPMGQGYRDMAPALDTLESEILNKRLAHGMHPVLTFCAANAVASKDPAGNRKLDKAKARGRIDGMVALAMAMRAATMNADDDGLSVYEDRGLLEIEL